MGTETSRVRLRRAATLWLALAAVGLPACGSASQNGAFASLRPQAAPADWKLSHTPAGAVLAYPPSWSAQHGDPGTATAALVGLGGPFLGYLNVTPHQGD